MRTFKDLGIAFGIILCVGVSAICLLPFFPIDETRSLAVAWEMWLNKSFLVPLLNGVPYSHKPPFLFWLIHLSWLIFGVNEVTPRLIPMLFGMANLLLVYRIALLLWPGDRKTARYAALLLASTLIYLVWSFLVIYEMLLTFWVLLAVFGVLLAFRQRGFKGWGLVSIGIAGGILTKGPVVLLHVVPLLLGAFWWGELRKGEGFSWIAKAIGAILLGILLAGFWVIPAVIRGGPAYRHAILWHQTAERVVSSFAHQRPVWWYFPMIPVVFLPWIFLKGAWTGLFSKEGIGEMGTKACAVWFLSTFVILSLVSGKQVYYLLPSIPGMILVVARNFSRWEERFPTRYRRPWTIAITMVILGSGALFLPMIPLGSNTGRLSWGTVLPVACVLLGLGIFLLLRRFRSEEGVLKGVAISVAVILSLFLISAGRGPLQKYNLQPLARLVKKRMDAGNCVAYIGTYHGEFQFLGRLKRPLVMLKGSRFKKYLKEHPDCLVIDTLRIKPGRNLEKEAFLYIQPFREERIIFMVKGRTYLKYFSGGG